MSADTIFYLRLAGLLLALVAMVWIAERAYHRAETNRRIDAMLRVAFKSIRVSAIERLQDINQ